MFPAVKTASLPQHAVAAQWFHALSDETRLEIVQMLSHGERCVCELQNTLDAAQSRLSFHLKTLKDAGLVTDRRDGRWIYYALNRDALDRIGAFANAVKPGSHAGSCARACCD
jgi:ArsR family transcriptional regulator, arsenate/arsenite/antimonite-responsive transcriptional repressor